MEYGIISKRELYERLVQGSSMPVSFITFMRMVKTLFEERGWKVSRKHTFTPKQHKAIAEELF
jgi:hypothetical protein